LAWLTLLPVSTALPVSSQRRAIASKILLAECAEASPACSILENKAGSGLAGRDIRGWPPRVKRPALPNLRIDEFTE
jgi:hypothetical protein